MSQDIPHFDPGISQRQADMMEHAAHDLKYAQLRKVPSIMAHGRHMATVEAGLFGKTLGGPCAKCQEANAEKGGLPSVS